MRSSIDNRQAAYATFACVSLNTTVLSPVQEGTDCSCDPVILESIRVKSARSPNLKSSWFWNIPRQTDVI